MVKTRQRSRKAASERKKVEDNDDQDKDEDNPPSSSKQNKRKPEGKHRQPLKRKLSESSEMISDDGEAPTPKRAKVAEVIVPEVTGSSSTHNGCGITPEAFKKLLEDRKAEFKRDARAKLENEVAKINERNSQDAAQNQLFPQVWTKLFEPPPPESDDEQSSSLVINPFYNQNTQRHRIRDILLPLMFHYKSPIVQGLSECPIWDPKWLGLRGVSRSMKEAMDKCYDDEFHETMWNKNSVAWPWLENRKPVQLHMPFDHRVFDKVYNIRAPLKLIRREMEVTIKSQSNLSGFRNESVKELSYSSHFKLFCDNVTFVLKQVGEQIWSFEFTFGHMAELEKCGVSMTEIYFVLKKWLLLLPNLKWLKIVAGLTVNQNVKAAVNLKKIHEAIIRTKPPPCLEYLQRLDFIVSSDYEYDYFQICDAIAGANPHIKMVNFNGNEFHHQIPHSNYEGLKLETLILESDARVTSESEFFGGIYSPHWNLKRLNLFVDLGGAPINSLIVFLNKFPTLEELVLRIGNVKIGGEMEFLKLPNIFRFLLEFYPIFEDDDDEEFNINENSYFFFSLQFLLYCGKLKLLDWANLMEECDCAELNCNIEEHVDENENTKTTMVCFNNGSGDLDDSNLRKVFPYLLKVCEKKDEKWWTIWHAYDLQ